MNHFDFWFYFAIFILISIVYYYNFRINGVHSNIPYNQHVARHSPMHYHGTTRDNVHHYMHLFM
jgi:hypothetical protein